MNLNVTLVREMNEEATEANTWNLLVDEDGVLTLPDEVWQTLGWMEGDSLEFIENDDGSFQIVKVDETPSDSREVSS
jgi:bifunctional DNA-binding transcriptional regulator/antitoxin component of YhaV-PrlF toxin-antitoxin module